MCQFMVAAVGYKIVSSSAHLMRSLGLNVSFFSLAGVMRLFHMAMDSCVDCDGWKQSSVLRNEKSSSPSLTGVCQLVC